VCFGLLLSVGGGITVVSQWCCSGVPVVLQWCCSYVFWLAERVNACVSVSMSVRIPVFAFMC
jgi:Gpi18-like mannosyltransferase